MKARFFRISSILLLTAAAIMSFLLVSMAAVEPQAHIYPDYPMANLSPVLQKDSFTEEDYQLLYLQTGLAKPAADEIRELYGDWRERLLRFQHNFFRKIDFVCEKNSPVSREESIVDEHGKYADGTEMAPLHEGYILITKSSHTYGWRNGHAALVVDAQNGKTLESVVLGQNSSIQHISKWTNYPNFMLLRPKGATYEEMKQAADTALELLHDIPYDLTIGIFSPKSAAKDKIIGTNCSHLIWQAYHYQGYDLDSDGGWIVTPNDIANSPYLEVVQVYGTDPRDIWP
jgi:uncharacterized protein YycO